jgi:hypothetical protein
MAFINHCGAHSVDREYLGLLEDPAPLTETHYPVRHDTFVDLARNVVDKAGYDILLEQYSLRQENKMKKDGLVERLPGGAIRPAFDNLFGYYEVQKRGTSGLKDIVHSVGLRNSNTMHNRGQLGCGERVFVCDNMAFSAQHTVARKHTKHIMDDLQELMGRAVAQLRGEFDRNEARVQIYKEAQLDRSDVHDIVCLAAERSFVLDDDGKITDKLENEKNCVPSSKLMPWIKEYKDPKVEDFRREDAWALKNALTEVAKEWDFISMQRRTEKVTKVLDEHIGFEDKYEEGSWRAN